MPMFALTPLVPVEEPIIVEEKVQKLMAFSRSYSMDINSDMYSEVMHNRNAFPMDENFQNMLKLNIY
ncbi:MAG: hypothetical protein AB9856_20155 [Cellulosilyticaceae bacterium]